MERRAALGVLLLLSGAAAAAEPVAPELATPPSLRKNVPVELPPGTSFPAPEVAVVLSLEVGADGLVTAAAVEQGAGEPFDAAALAAARRLEFEPGRLASGEAVPVTVSFQMRILAPPPPPVEKPRPPPFRLSGTLLEKGTRRPLADVAVEARAGEQTLAIGASDAAGRFRLEVPEPEFRLLAVPADHGRLDAPVKGVAGEERAETYYLEPVPTGYVAVVRGDRVRREVTRQVLPAEEVAVVAGTQGDTLKAVTNLPGVARVVADGGLVLRGSSPGDSAVFIEGLQTPVLFHFGGLRSVFAPRFLDSLEFVPGNFSADYGRLIGGIVNVRVRDPSSDLVRGEADFNLYEAALAVEGPLAETVQGGAAFRRSWIDAVLPIFLPRDAPLSFTSAPRYYDYQFLTTWRPTERDKVRLLFFGSQDKLVAILKRPAGDPVVAGDLQFKIAFHELTATWGHTFSPSLKQESWVGVGLQDNVFEIGPSLFFKLGFTRLDARSTWSWQALPWLEGRAGIDLQWSDYRIQLDLPRPPKEGEDPAPVSTTGRIGADKRGQFYQPGAFAELRISPVEGVDVLPSLRADWSRSIERWSLDPRLAARWRALPGTVLKGAVGIHQQPPAPDESDPDVGTRKLRFKRSVQVSAGAERSILPGLDLDLTGFYKKLDRLVVPNRSLDPAAPVYTNEGTGRIYGLELLLRARFGERFFGWIAYTFQRSFRVDRPGAAERRFDFDQPHILTAVGTWKPSARWSFGGRFRLVSGNPYTPIDGAIYDAGSDVFVPIRGPANSARLAPFHALDLRADRIWSFDRWKLSLYLDVQNVYNRGNPEGWQYRFDYGERSPATGLPILPIFGLKGEW